MPKQKKTEVEVIESSPKRDDKGAAPVAKYDEAPIFDGLVWARVKGGYTVLRVWIQEGRVLEAEALRKAPESRLVAAETMKIELLRQVLPAGAVKGDA